MHYLLLKLTIESSTAIKKGRWLSKKGRRPSKKAVKAAMDVYYVPQTSKKAVCRQKRPSAVKKGREGCHGRLVRAADIKKGLEDSRGLLEGQEEG